MWDVLDATDGIANRAGGRGAVPRPDWRPQTHFEARGRKLGHGGWDLLSDRGSHRRTTRRRPGTTLTRPTDMELVLGLVFVTMVMFLFERIRADVVALVVLVVLGLTGLVAPEDLFGGFSSDAVINVIATMILGAGLDRTGALNRLAGWLLRRARGVEQRLLLLASAVAGLNSAVIQNTSVTALYLPVASRLSARTGISLSRLLMPISAAIIMGGG